MNKVVKDEQREESKLISLEKYRAKQHSILLKHIYNKIRKEIGERQKLKRGKAKEGYDVGYERYEIAGLTSELREVKVAMDMTENGIAHDIQIIHNLFEKAERRSRIKINKNEFKAIENTVESDVINIEKYRAEQQYKILKKMYEELSADIKKMRLKNDEISSAIYVLQEIKVAMKITGSSIVHDMKYIHKLGEKVINQNYYS